MLKFHPRQPKSSYEARYFARLRDEYQARGPRVLQFPASQQRPLETHRAEPSAPQPSSHPDRTEPEFLLESVTKP